MQSDIQDGHHGRNLKNLFFASSPELKGQLTRNLVGSIGVTCRSKIAKIVPIVNPSWLPFRVCSNDHAQLTGMPYIFFKIKNCLNDDLFISCDDRIGKMLHNICISAVAMSLRWTTRGPWASCLLTCPRRFCCCSYFFLTGNDSGAIGVFFQKIVIKRWSECWNCWQLELQYIQSLLAGVKSSTWLSNEERYVCIK